MTLTEYQLRAEKTILPQCRNISYLALGLANEAGEVAGKVKKMLREPDRTDLVQAAHKELGDTLWYLSQLALQLNATLEYIAVKNLEKLEKRAESNQIVGDGDDR